MAKRKYKSIISNQLKEDLEYDQITLKEYMDPFTGVASKRKIKNL